MRRLQIAVWIVLASAGLWACDSGPESGSPTPGPSERVSASGPEPEAEAEQGALVTPEVAEPLDEAGAAPESTGERVDEGEVPRFLDSPAHPIYEDAVTARGGGETDYAVTLLRQAVALDPEHTDAWALLFELTRTGDDPELPADACAGLLAHWPLTGYEAAHWNLQCAAAQRRAGRLTEAETYARQSVEHAGGRLEPLITLSGILLEQRRGEDAIGVLEGRVRTSGGELEASALSNLGAAYLLTDRVQDAVATLESARAISPRRTDILLNLADALERAGRAEEAVEVLNRILELEPGNAGALRRLED